MIKRENVLEQIAILGVEDVFEQNKHDTILTRDKIMNRLNKRVIRYKIAIVIILLIISLFYISFEGYFKDTELFIDFTELDANRTGDITNINPDQLTTSFHGIHKKTCDDLTYGCCQIMANCETRDNYVDAVPINIDLYRIIPHDLIHSNCPSLDQIAHLYNRHYKDKKDCSETEHGCCPSINTACDYTFHMVRENSDEMVEFYNDNMYHSHHSRISKVDVSGSNCPKNYYALIDAYEWNWPKKEDEDDGIFMIGLIAIIIFFLCGN